MDKVLKAVAVFLPTLIMLVAFPGHSHPMEERVQAGLSVLETYDSNIDYGAGEEGSDEDENNLVTNVSGGLDYSAVEPGTEYGLGLSLSHRFDHGDSTNDRTNGDLSASAGHAFSDRLSGNLSTSLRVDHSLDESTTEFGIVVEPQLRYTVSTSVGGSYRLDETNSLSGGLSYSMQTGDGEDIADSNSYGLFGSWRRGISEVSSFGLSPSFRHSTSERENSETTSDYLSIQASYNYEHTEDWTFNFGLGPSFSRTTTKEEVETAAGELETEETDHVTTYAVSSGANWKISERLGSGFSFSRSQTQSIIGDNVINYRLSGRFNYRLGERSSARFGLNYARSSSTGDDESSENENYRFLAGYNYSLTEDLDLTFSYTYSEHHDITDDEITVRQRFSLGLSTSFEALLD